MSRRTVTKLVREGEFVAEVAVDLIDTEGGWAPYLSRQDAEKLDEVRLALRAGNIQRAAHLADHLYRLTPVEAA